MHKLTPEGEKLIEDIAKRHRVSVDAVKVMLDAVQRGGGTMAQFSHPELGGAGQWLRGGMTMVGDMFDNALKARVDALASELSAIVTDEPATAGKLSPASQTQSQSSGSGARETAVFASSSSSQSSGDWWPTDLGSPSSTGAQNDMRYAYFPGKRRLALYRGGHVEILDTGEHIISGFGQQQGGSDALTLTSQLGTVPLSKLKRVDAVEDAPAAEAHASFAGTGPAATPAAEPAQSSAGLPSDPASILSLVEKLGELRDKGVLSEDEFAAKKAELLKRL